MNDKEIKDWTRVSVWTLRFMIALGFFALCVIAGIIIAIVHIWQ